MRLILATDSKCRREAFKILGLSFFAEGSRINDNSPERPRNPHDLVVFLARSKVMKALEKYNGECIIGFDSVGELEGKILEKPRSYDDAFERLRELSGSHHKFYTGVYILNSRNGAVSWGVSKTDIYLREISENEIKRYLDNCEGEYRKRALGYTPLSGYSQIFVKRVEGSTNHLSHGVPLELIPKMLREAGFRENLS